MKRFLALVLILLAAAGCAAGDKGPAGLLDSGALLPDEGVVELAGVPMRLAYDSRDPASGTVRWAWEETEGLPKLLIVVFRFPPADCDGLFADAQANSETMAAPEGVAACYDDRAAHLRVGSFYIRIALLGFSNEKDVLGQLIFKLADAVHTMENSR